MNREPIIQPSQARLAEIDSHIKREGMKLNEKAREQGKSFGKENKPAEHAPLNNYLRFIQEEARLLYRHLAGELEQLRGSLSHSLSQLQEREAQAEATIQSCTHNINLLEQEMPKDAERYPWPIWPYLVLGIGIIFGLETVWNGISFQLFGQSLLVSILMALGISASILLLFHGFRKSLGFAKTKTQRWLIILGWILFYSLVFLGLALMREAYLETRGIEHRISPVFYVIINWLLLLGAAFVLSKAPSWEALKTKLEQIPFERSRRKLEAQKELAMKEVAQIKVELTTMQTLIDNLPAFEKHLLEWLRALSKKSMADFVAVNITYRSDGVCSFTYDAQDPLHDPSVSFLKLEP